MDNHGGSCRVNRTIEVIIRVTVGKLCLVGIRLTQLIAKMLTRHFARSLFSGAHGHELVDFVARQEFNYHRQTYEKCVHCLSLQCDTAFCEYGNECLM